MENTPKDSLPQDSSNDSTSAPDASRARRGFFAQASALVLWFGAVAVPTVVGLLSFSNPLRQRGRDGRFLKITSLDVLPSDGTPRRFPVLADRTDAWNRFPNEPVGALYLRRLEDDQVEAIHVVCPHAGCFVDYDAAEDIFFCPCHQASFSLEGKRLDETSPSPRDLDTLEAEVRGKDEVWVKFQNFRTGTPEKIAEV
jgi:menaquinol-cytochrome c reductase iron-sulfur subunit